MGDWYVVRGKVSDGYHKYMTRLIVYAETVNEAKEKAKSNIGAKDNCLFIPMEVHRLDKNRVY